MTRAKQNTKAVVIYTRVSTKEQGKSGLGLNAQLAACQKLAEYQGLEIVGVHCEVISGKIDPRERPVFLQALKQAQANGASILVSKQDRFSREVFHVSGYVNNHLFGSKTPDLIAADAPDASPMEIYLKAMLSEKEREAISERTKAALAVKKAQGAELGKAGRQAHSAKAQQATETAITRARELRESGMSLDKVCSILNAEGYTTSRGSHWSKQALNKRLVAA